MLILDATTKTLEVDLDGAITTNQLPFQANYVDVTTTTYTPSENDGTTNSTTNVTLVAAPAASTQRQVKLITVYNADTVAAVVSIIYNNNATLRTLVKVTLAVGSTLIYTDGEGWRVLTTTGQVITGGGAPGDATYITQTVNATLTAEQALSTLATGIMQVTTGTGVITSVTTSAGLAALLSDETGTGAVVFGTSPTLITPALGTPASGVATNLTGLPAAQLTGTITSATQDLITRLGTITSGVWNAGAVTSSGAVIGTILTAPSITTASGALGITPAAGSNLNVTLSTTGDFAVNTNQFYVDTSTGNAGFGTGVPAQLIDARGATVNTAGFASIGNSDLTNFFIVGSGRSGDKWTRFFFSNNATNSSGFQIATSAADTSGVSEKVVILTNGNMGIGTTGPPTGGGPALALGQGTQPTGIALNTAGIWVQDVAGTAELMGFDEAGNDVQLTPHNFTLFSPPADHPFPWAYYASNAYLGVEMGVDLARLVQLVERLTGETLTHVRTIPTEDWVAHQSAIVQRAIAEVTAWKTQRDAFTPTTGVPIFPVPCPVRPVVKAPPAWLAARLAKQGRTLDLVSVIQTLDTAWPVVPSPERLRT